MKYVVMFCLLIGVALVGARSNDATIEENIVYGHADDKDLMLDLARPTGPGPFPAIVFIHGGAFIEGDRKDFRPVIAEAARRGYVGVSISYRLMKLDMTQKETTTAKWNFPAQVYDAKAAVRWLRASAEKYQVDPHLIGVAGVSAGGYLALMIGLTEPQDQLEGDSGNPDISSRVGCVVNFYGPTELKSCYETSVVAWAVRLFLNGKPDENPAIYQKASPVTYVTKDDPPVLTFHGDQDKLVNIEQSRILDAKMKEVGAPHTLIEFPGQGHGFDGDTSRTAIQKLWAFLDQNLKPATGRD